LLLVEFGAELLPVGRRQTREAVDLLDQQNIAGSRISDEPKQFRSGELRAGFILDVGRRDDESTLGGESLDLIAGPTGVLFVGRGPEVAARQRSQ